MVLKHDKDRVSVLLRDTITLLCRNGLTFKSKFSVEALIGVTLDDEDVFLININEIIKNEKAAAELEAGDSDEISDGETVGTRGKKSHKRRKRKRPRIKNEDGFAGEIDQEKSDETFESTGDDSDPGEFLGGEEPSSEPDVKRPNIHIKKEINQEEESDNSNDIVFIKSELQDWSQSGAQNDVSGHSSMFGGLGESSMMQADQNFTSLSGADLVPVGSQEGTSMWNQAMGSQQQQPRPYRPRVPRTSNVMGDQMSPSLEAGQSQFEAGDMQGQDQQQIMDPNVNIQQQDSYSYQSPGTFIPNVALTQQVNFSNLYNSYCKICSKKFRRPYDLKVHNYAKHLGKVFRCPVCNKSFSYKWNLNLHIKGVHRSGPV